MRDHGIWSLNLGRWGGVQIRLHVSLLLLAVGVLYLAPRRADGLWPAEAVLFLVALFLALVIHELGHALVAFRCGGGTENIVLGPLGNLAQPELPHDPQLQLRVALAGPLANLAACGISGALLFFSSGQLSFLSPLRFPYELSAEIGGLARYAPHIFWVNWLMFLVNLLPAYPADGGYALRAALWRTMGHRSAVIHVARVSKFVSLGLLILAFLASIGRFDGEAAWLPLVMLAILTYFCARREVARLDEQESADELFGYDFSQGYTSLERGHETPRRPAMGPFRSWLARRRETRRLEARRIEEEEERRADEILARLHQCGMDGLTAEERSLLQRVSLRVRQRLGG